ncbi:virulence protein [Lachnospiraceae bacterium ZAX-1]
MEVQFNVTGSERKAFVKAISETLNVKPKYKGMPSMAYEIDYFTVDKNGTLIFDDRADSEEIEQLLEGLADKGFVAAPTEMAEIWLEKRTEELSEETDTEPQSEHVGLTVAMPKTYFMEDAMENLKHLLDAKGGLIKKALDIDALPIETDDEKVSFPWFSFTPNDSDTVNAYTHLIYALCEMAGNQKRITSTEKTVDNEKYAFRCFLLRLGFIGAEYKTERKILLKNFTGSSAFKGGAKNEISK